MQAEIKSAEAAVDWPTVGLLSAAYLAFAVSTTVLSGWSLLAGVIITGVLIAQFSSLQHEVLHGHPFRWQWLNEALVFPAMTVFVPYERFRDTHLAHHRDEYLTDPYEDPESNYLCPDRWNTLSSPRKILFRFHNTLAGRMIVGPAVSIVRLLRDDLGAIARGNRAVTRAWLLHFAGVGIVIGWLSATGGMPVWAYVIAAYIGFGLLKIRTFLEHRAHERASGRTVVIEDHGPLALLFLNNNLHVVHHMHPKVAWYRLPALYRAHRAHYHARNDGYVFKSYAEIFRRYFLKAKDPVPHPIWRRK